MSSSDRQSVRRDSGYADSSINRSSFPPVERMSSEELEEYIEDLQDSIARLSASRRPPDRSVIAVDDEVSLAFGRRGPLDFSETPSSRSSIAAGQTTTNVVGRGSISDRVKDRPSSSWVEASVGFGHADVLPGVVDGGLGSYRRVRFGAGGSRTTTDEKSAQPAGDHVTLRRRRFPTPPTIDVEAVANVVSPPSTTAMETERPPSVASSVDIGRRKLPTIKLGTYDGSTALETFLAKFENCAAYYSWSRCDRLFHLKASLEGHAGMFCGRLRQMQRSRISSSCCEIVLATRTRWSVSELNCVHVGERRANLFRRFTKIIVV